jgi:hypothetical protein
MKRLTCFVTVAAAVVVATWVGGWWTVPVIALIAGLLRCQPAIVAGACATGWAALLLWDVAAGEIGRLSGMLSGIMGLPSPALFLITLAFPGLLGWSAASLGDAARSFRPTSRQPS